jgi:hypothetical protein
MKRTLLTTVTVALLLAVVGPAARATEVGYSRKIGVGVELGDPTGLTAKFWTSPTNALDFGLGFWTYGNGACFNDANGQVCDAFGHTNGTFNMDYLWQSNIIRGTAQLDWHIGGGGRMVWWGGCTSDCIALSARAPVGLDLMFTNPNFVEVFFEIAPAFWVFPNLGLGFDGDLGVRLYF